MVSKGLEETILCLAKSMRTQDEQNKNVLAARSLLVCCSSSTLFSTNEHLWLKFLYLIFDQQRKQIDQYLQNNIEELVRICTNNQRLQKVLHRFLVLFFHQNIFFTESNISN